MGAEVFRTAHHVAFHDSLLLLEVFLEGIRRRIEHELHFRALPRI